MIPASVCLADINKHDMQGLSLCQIQCKLIFILLGPVGLDWNKLKETLNPEFDWNAAVQAALKTDDSLENVCYCLLA